MPEPSGRDIFNEPKEVESSGFHDNRYVSAAFARSKELWDKAAGFWDETTMEAFRRPTATRNLTVASQRRQTLI